ncbi:terminase [Helicobacter ailurogastricus]|uniref:Uncharacterized protein n=1 Tax=Helicobacter ailurogastricus TaxID=1578720 RepID=A0A0K2XAY5_9HELI|nr:terminase [Helicobacter ailurogastricus]GMB91868.1 DNA-binding protein [Helicobacter ailurogastricus]CRF40801.1 hypothetical protein HAL011_05660 [Helicobacter ailurogastricus]CRF42723.1 hypothetical protein HAL013_09230 [Helicobacter ailurogastricus]CRF44912.1 hypothetical protein HAL09_15330 [Helicobacter ailurogastricus]
MGRAPLYADKKDAVRQAYETSKTTHAQLSKEFGVPYGTIARWVLAEGWKRLCPETYKKKKAEAKAYYETHDVDFKELAKFFEVSEGTMKKWAQEEGWEPCKARKEVEVEVITDSMLDHSIDTFIGAKKEQIKDSIRERLQDADLDPIVLEALLETSSDELLMKAMNLNYINKNILLSAIIAKDELMRMVRYNANNPKGNPVIIAAAEKVAKMFADLKISLFGKEQSTLVAPKPDNDYSKMTTDELLKIANNLEEEN